MMKTIGLLIFAIGLIGTLVAQNAPDLIIEEIEPPKWDGGTVLVIKVKNIGKSPSDTVQLKIWDIDWSLEEAKKKGVERKKHWIFEENMSRSDDGENDYDINFERFEKIPPLKNNESFSVTIKLDHWVYDSNCEIGATIDWNNQLKEKNEQNNSSYFFEGG